MYGYIYKITNLINNKIYIGKHKYKDKRVEKIDLDLKYFASGKIIRRAIVKYGKDSFMREILQYAKDRTELNTLEKYYIALYEKSGYTMYNLAPGGEGGDLSKFIDYSKCTKSGADNWNFGKHYKWCNNGINQLKLYGGDELPDGYEFGTLPMSDEQKLKISLSKIGLKLPQSTKDVLSKLWIGENNPSSKNPKFGEKIHFMVNTIQKNQMLKIVKHIK